MFWEKLKILKLVVCTFIYGKENENDNGQFVSSVCWRGKEDMVIAVNSTGCIKVLQMVC